MSRNYPPLSEPCGWVQLGLMNGRSYVRDVYQRNPYPPPPSIVRNLCLVPVYTVALPEPLTEAQIMELTRDEFASPRWPSSAIEVARAVERAHGIGADKP